MRDGGAGRLGTVSVCALVVQEKSGGPAVLACEMSMQCHLIMAAGCWCRLCAVPHEKMQTEVIELTSI